MRLYLLAFWRKSEVCENGRDQGGHKRHDEPFFTESATSWQIALGQVTGATTMHS